MTIRANASRAERTRLGNPHTRRPANASITLAWVLALAALLASPAVRAAEPAPPEGAPPPAGAEAAPPPAQPPAAQEPATTPEATDPAEAAPPPDEAPAEAPPEAPEPDEPTEPAEPPPPPMEPGGPLRLNFKDASVHAVLEYLSEATGLIILQETPIEGRITLISRQPISTDEAVGLLDSVLKDKGYTTVRTGRTLKVVSLAKAARENLPVFSGNDPEQIPLADRLVTQVIPVRFVDATKLRTDLAALIPETATLSANAASNTLVLVDTQANIRRIVEIIRALDDHMAGEAEIKVFQLEYADATSAAQLISQLFEQEDARAGESTRRFPFPFMGGDRGGGRGSRDRESDAQGREQTVIAAADDRTNTLVVSAPPEQLAVIEGIVKELDSNPSEEESFFIYPLKNADAVNLEEVFNAIFSETTTAGGTARSTTSTGGRTSPFSRTRSTQQMAASSSDLVGQVYCVADEDTNSLLVRAPTKHFDRLKEMLAELDTAIRQVLIKVLIAEVTHEDELDLGTEFSVLNIQYGADLEVTGDLGGTDERPGGLVTATMGTNLAATFNALQREGRMDVLSRPYILASDNQEATITVGQEVPFIRNSRTTETGQTINTIEYEDVGIILTVTPHVNPDGLVIMNVTPEISTITDTTIPISETVNATVYAKRSATTQVAIHNGQTIVIGGLMEDRIIEATRKVPFLGDIPLLGELFKSTNEDKTKTELLIFLTPHVAEQPEQLPAMSADETANIQAVQEAGGSGAFETHLDSMQRGATPPKPDPEPEPDPAPALEPEPKKDDHETQP